jgi:hypothetical protein
MVAQVTIDDVYSVRFNHLGWFDTLDCAHCGFVRCEPRFSAIVTLQRFFTSRPFCPMPRFSRYYLAPQTPFRAF